MVGDLGRGGKENWGSGGELVGEREGEGVKFGEHFSPPRENGPPKSSQY